MNKVMIWICMALVILGSAYAADDAVCDEQTDCVLRGECFDQGYIDVQSRFSCNDVAGDVDCDGDSDYCENSVWYDCGSGCAVDNGCCPLSYKCENNDCVWVDCDTSQVYCESEPCGYSTYDTSMYFEAGNPDCCGDDSNEHTNECHGNTAAEGTDEYIGWSCIAADTACCGSMYDCVKDGSCYANGFHSDLNPSGNDNKAYCVELPPSYGYWADPDEDSSTCSGGLYWEASGAAGVGEYDFDGAVECCGDDSSEVYNYRRCNTNDCTTDSSDDACCPEVACVYNGNCYQVGYATERFENPYTGWDEANIVCVSQGSYAEWQDCDASPENCAKCDEATDLPYCTGSECWISAGLDELGEYIDTSTAECCGDDWLEYYDSYGGESCDGTHRCCSSGYYGVRNSECVTSCDCPDGQYTVTEQCTGATVTELCCDNDTYKIGWMDECVPECCDQPLCVDDNGCNADDPYGCAAETTVTGEWAQTNPEQCVDCFQCIEGEWLQMCNTSSTGYGDCACSGYDKAYCTNSPPTGAEHAGSSGADSWCQKTTNQGSYQCYCWNCADLEEPCSVNDDCCSGYYCATDDPDGNALDPTDYRCCYPNYGYDPISLQCEESAPCNPNPCTAEPDTYEWWRNTNCVNPGVKACCSVFKWNVSTYDYIDIIVYP